MDFIYFWKMNLEVGGEVTTKVAPSFFMSTIMAYIECHETVNKIAPVTSVINSVNKEDKSASFVGVVIKCYTAGAAQ